MWNCIHFMWTFVWIMCIIYSIYLNVNNQPVEEKCGKTINNQNSSAKTFSVCQIKWEVQNNCKTNTLNKRKSSMIQ